MSSRAGGKVLASPISLKWLGCLLLIVALAVLVALTTVSGFYPSQLVIFSYCLMAVGLALYIVNKLVEWRFRRRVRSQKVLCRNCGWTGSGALWLRSECCPECDSEEVVTAAADQPVSDFYF